MPRTDANSVKAILQDDYGPRVDGSLPDLTPFITAANGLTNRVAALAAANSQTLSSDELTVIEGWLAAYFYALSDKPLQNTNQGGSSGTFVGSYSNGLKANPYGTGAMALDWTGSLATIDQQMTSGRKVASLEWVGKPPSQQIDYDQRD